MFRTKQRRPFAYLASAVAAAILGVLALTPVSSGAQIPVTVKVDETHDEAPAAAPSQPVEDGTPGGLPMTGAELGAMIALALGLVATGTLLWFGSARARRQS